MPQETALFAKEYLNLTAKEGINWGLMRGVWASAAEMAIVPMQDILGLDSSARMNTPSTLGENWKWRALPGEMNHRLAKKLMKYMIMYGRKRME